jgi:hypothetical protein
MENNSTPKDASFPPVRLTQPTPRDGHLIVARNLLQGVEALSTLSNISPRSCSLLAAQAMECALKAFLCHKGKEKETLRAENRHNLVALWGMAYKEMDLKIEQEPPGWCKILDSGFYLRYQVGEKKTVLHGGQTPPLIPMAAELKKFIEMVMLAIKGKTGVTY